ncbi:MAG: hypothetical protein QOH04_999 [Sphingomonadales bacterium]|nr:hypothetical protein [Sphingomonadales bacterium]MEA3035240.1 hypothetical protein [Sphingomonadales bacterium]
MDRVIARMGARQSVRELSEAEAAAVAGGTAHWVPSNPNSGNLASDEGYWEFD